MPEPASSTLKPPGAWITASSSVALPVKTSCRVILGCRFSTTSRLARPRSASSTSTRWPRRGGAAARVGGGGGGAGGGGGGGGGGGAPLLFFLFWGGGGLGGGAPGGAPPPPPEGV